MIETGVINPNVRAEVAVNPDSELFPVTRSNGVLHALSVPQSNGLIAGRSALMSLDGWTWEDMVLKSSVGMHPDLYEELKAFAGPVATAGQATYQKGKRINDKKKSEGTHILSNKAIAVAEEEIGLADINVVE